MDASRSSGRYATQARPLILSYWIMPLVAGLAVILVAAAMLTEVVILANRIDSNVTPIRQSTLSISTHADGIAVLNQVDTTAKAIQAAAAPLTGQAGTILDTVGTIQGTVGQIDTATGSILGHANAISAQVDSITPHVRLIAEPVERIVAKLQTTNSDLTQALAVVSGARSDLASVAGAGLLPTVNDHARSIDCHLGALTGPLGAPSTACGNP